MEQSGPRGTDESATGEPPTDADADAEAKAEAETTVEEAPPDEQEQEQEWQFGLDEVGPDGIIEDEPEPIEPETPKLENVVFVLLGVVGTLFLLSTVI